MMFFFIFNFVTQNRTNGQTDERAEISSSLYKIYNTRPDTQLTENIIGGCSPYPGLSPTSDRSKSRIVTILTNTYRRTDGWTGRPTDGYTLL